MQSSVSLVMLVWMVGLVVAGLYLVVRGWWGRRVGTEPRCRECGYILLHLESGRCPECGSEVAEWNTVVGQRKRLWARLAAGCGLVVIGCLPIVGPVTNRVAAIPWYQYKPTRYVLEDVDGAATWQKAVAELQRREKAGELAGWAREKLIEKALAEQVAATPVRQELVDFLGTAWLGGHLAGKQKETFLDNLCRVTMTVRPIVAEGDRVPFWVWDAGRGPGGPQAERFWMRRDDDERLIDGKVVRRSSGGSTGGLTGVCGTGSSEPAGAVGKHRLEVKLKSSVWCGAISEDASSQLIGRRDVAASIEYEVVPKEKAPRIELLDSEELRAKVLAAVKPGDFRQQKDGYLNASMHLTTVPCDLAFEVFVQADGVETDEGSICCAKGKGTQYGTGRKSPRLPAKVKVILRPSVEVAKGTVDETAIYGGEIVFPEVEVKQEGE